MSDLLTKLEEKIKEVAPEFEVKPKNESRLMRVINKILFFNNAFMSGYITTIGQKVYWATGRDYRDDPDGSFNTLAHEFVHVMDYMQKPVRFSLSYLFPQILALPGVLFVLLSPILIPLMCLSILSPWFLLALASLVFLAPIPSPGRKRAEMRGYGMTARVYQWKYGTVPDWRIERSVRAFTGPNYYFMWPFDSKVRAELAHYGQVEDPPFLKDDPNPAWEIVRRVLEENGGLHG